MYVTTNWISINK